MCLDYILLLEEIDKNNQTIEIRKAALLSAFPSKENLRILYKDPDEEEYIHDRVPTTHEEFIDLMDILQEVQFGNSMEEVD